MSVPAVVDPTLDEEEDFEYKYVNRDAIDGDLCCVLCREPFMNPVRKDKEYVSCVRACACEGGASLRQL